MQNTSQPLQRGYMQRSLSSLVWGCASDGQGWGGGGLKDMGWGFKRCVRVCV